MKTITHNELCDLLVRYAANGVSADYIATKLGKDDVEVAKVLAAFQHDWDNTEVDEEGATPEQDAELDKLLNIYATDLLN